MSDLAGYNYCYSSGVLFSAWLHVLLLLDWFYWALKYLLVVFEWLRRCTWNILMQPVTTKNRQFYSVENTGFMRIFVVVVEWDLLTGSSETRFWEWKQKITPLNSSRLTVPHPTALIFTGFKCICRAKSCLIRCSWVSTLLTLKQFSSKLIFNRKA